MTPASLALRDEKLETLKKAVRHWYKEKVEHGDVLHAGGMMRVAAEQWARADAECEGNSPEPFQRAP